MDNTSLAAVDANLLVALDALLSEQHVGRAARRVGLSESAMSHALARARRLFEDPLLVRAGRSMVLTRRAQAMAPRLRSGLAEVAAAVQLPASLDLASECRDVRVATTDFCHSMIGVALYHQVSREAPQVNLLFTPVNRQSESKLVNGELDLVISKPERQPKLHSQPLIEERFVSMVRAEHPVLEKRMTAKRFAALDHVVVSPVLKRFGALNRELGKRKLVRRIAYVSPTFMAAARLVAETDLVLTGSERSATEVAAWLELAVFPTPVKLAPFQQWMFWHERHHEDPFLSWFRERVVDAAKA